MSTERIVVIGSNSFSGASFVAHALQAGATVVGISRSAEPHEAFLPYKWIPHDRFRFVECDINHGSSDVAKLVADFQPQYVVNFAAQGMVAQSWERPQDWYLTNTVAMARLHDELRKFSFLKKFVHASTPEVYGSTSGVIREDAPYNPSTPYAVSKAACDMNLFAFHRAYSFPIALTRSANVCGPAQALYRIIPKTVLCIMAGERLKLQGGGLSVRSFIHIRDVCEATLRIARDAKPGGIYHLSTDRRVTIRALVEEICRRMGAPFEKNVEVVEGRLGQDAAYLLDSSRARNELGWSPDITLETMIQETIDWAKKYWDVLKQQPRDYVHKP